MRSSGRRHCVRVAKEMELEIHWALAAKVRIPSVSMHVHVACPNSRILRV